MLIAGDGHTNIFGPDVSSLDPRTWYENASGQALMHGLRHAKLTAKKIPEGETLKDDDKAWEYFDELKFDVVLANPPFAGEMKDRKMLVHYELAKPALKRAGDDKQPKEERDVLFIERILKMLKPGGRAAIVLPQGKFNNSSLAFIREWILKKARLLAVVGLHPNTFKPHTGTKTSVLFVQKYTQDQIEQIAKIHDQVAVSGLSGRVRNRGGGVRSRRKERRQPHRSSAGPFGFRSVLASWQRGSTDGPGLEPHNPHRCACHARFEGASCIPCD